MSRYASGRGRLRYAGPVVHGTYLAFDGNPYWRIGCVQAWVPDAHARATPVPDDTLVTCLLCIHYNFDRPVR